MKSLLLFCASVLLASGTAFAQDDTGNPQATLHTSKGDIRIELFEDKAPISVANFLQYARDGFYDGTVFHRVISHFMIQGGGYDANMQRKPTREPIQNEATNGLSNQRGTVAMARTTDPHSATAQFFINVEANGNLDYTGTENSRTWGYTVFGKVIEGMNVVDDIRLVQTDARDRPLETVVIESVELH
ncbi:MAG: peptidyl-prolyl cis-trans isomerase [Xanthomonadales bacterium]|nr:peptidyl-prolyl cis-trans isomerase [Xanthomonadales bacterium]